MSNRPRYSRTKPKIHADFPVRLAVRAICDAMDRDGRVWKGLRPGDLDECAREARRCGVAPPQPAEVRGVAAVRLGDVVLVPWRGEILVGLPDKVEKEMTRGTR